ncbi:hypothetical protein [Coleofasciculus sp. F4-SAH-05]|uniref:hypothetical protein n=1 Tax=Coleofasciculus sp. F4-SAH-05 TaxID=3069525 RepID=UPI0032F59F12
MKLLYRKKSNSELAIAFVHYREFHISNENTIWENLLKRRSRNGTDMRTFKWVIWGLLGIICAIALIYFSPEPQPAVPQESSCTLSQPAGNQPSFYPLEQDIDPTFYHSVGDWVGRLILHYNL